jgi:putative spermidine/putrescine transport system substrate-binding protein
MPARTPPLAVALLALSTAAAVAHDLVVVTRSEAQQSAVAEIHAQPFSASTDTPVSLESWEGGMDTLRQHAKATDNTWDVVLVDAAELATGCNEGLFEKVDWSAVGGRDHYQQIGTSDCGVGAFVSSVVLAWDRDKFQGNPSWADFWDVAKYPGKRGLRMGVRGNLEIALLADGVAPGDVYKTLATNDGVDRAFRRLEQLKPYIVWWQTEAEAVRILASGDVLMTSATSNRIVMANRGEKRNLGLQWAASLYDLLSWAVIKGSPELRPAQQFIYFAGNSGVEARMLRLFGEAGLAKGVTEALPAELQAMSASNPANLSPALRVDSGFWADNQAKLRQKFEAWLGGNKPAENRP